MEHTLHPKKLIIFVDDNVANLKTGKNILSTCYHVATAPSAEKLFCLLEKNTPDLILLDIEMPGMDGYEAIDALKKDAKTKHIPVIFVSGRTHEDDQRKGLALGAVDYITKPFSPKNVKHKIGKALG